MEKYLSRVQKVKGIIPVLLITARNYKLILPKLQAYFGHLPELDLNRPTNRFELQSQPENFAQRYQNGVLVKSVHLFPELLETISKSVNKSTDGPYVVVSPYFDKQWNSALASSKLKIAHLPFDGSTFADVRGLSFSKTELFSFGPDYLLNEDAGAAQQFYKNYLDELLTQEILAEVRLKHPMAFLEFLGLMALHAGSPLHFSNISKQIGISVNSIIQWVELLERKQWVYKLTNFDRAWNKRLIKHHKYLFNEIGLAHFLYHAYSPLKNTENFRANLFHNLVINDMRINLLQTRRKPEIKFWHDHKNRGISSIVNTGKKLLLTDIIPESLDGNFPKHLQVNMKLVKKLSKSPQRNCFIIHTGDQSYDHLLGRVLSWRDM